MATRAIHKLPGVLSFKRGHVISDGGMYSRMPDDREVPVPVIRHGIRATQNVAEGAGAAEGGTASSGSRDPRNLQTIESAKLDPDAVALVIRFSLGMLDLDESLDAVAARGDSALARRTRESIGGFIARAKPSQGLQEVCRRMARNIANARWTWRNRTIASAIDVLVDDSHGAPVAHFDAFAIPRNSFEGYTAVEVALADELARQMRGESDATLVVTATLRLRARGAVEVFPSQNYTEDKPVSRSLYKLGRPSYERAAGSHVFEDTPLTGLAALRDQKIWNAIRTIDTWYPDFAEVGLAIPVEPMGASLAQLEFYRKGKASSFELFKRLDEIDPNSGDGMFCIAALERGGVYGESEKKTSAGKETADAA